MNRWHFLSLHLLLLLLLLSIAILYIVINVSASQIILSHVKDLRLLVLAPESRAYTILVQYLFVHLLVVLNLVRNLRQVNDFLSLISGWIWLTSWRGRNISMMKLIMRALSCSWNLIFADSNIREFGDWNDFLLPKSSHLVSRLWSPCAWALTTHTAIIELNVLLKDATIFARSLDVNLRRILVSRSGSAWRV